VQQDNGGSGRGAGLAVEDPAIADLGEAMMRDHF
jgi:hypothetical protein